MRVRPKLRSRPIWPIPRNPNAEQSGPFVMIQGPQTDVISYKRVETCLRSENPKSLHSQPQQQSHRFLTRREPQPEAWPHPPPQQTLACAGPTAAHWLPAAAPSCAAAGRVTRDSRAGPRSDAGAPWGQAAPAAVPLGPAGRPPRGPSSRTHRESESARR